jgi:hypothetical protein
MTRLEFTLDWVNKVRGATGLKALKSLPKGERNRSRKCPVAIGIGGEVASGDMAYVMRNGIVMEIMTVPSTVGNFVDAFDDGKYPELER